MSVFDQMLNDETRQGGDLAHERALKAPGGAPLERHALRERLLPHFGPVEVPGSEPVAAASIGHTYVLDEIAPSDGTQDRATFQLQER